ncbi:MAG: aminotransferase class IV [Pseudomonadales bacterium]
MTNQHTEANAFFNGQYVPIDQVAISPFDRGFLLGDSIYEAVPAYNGTLLGAERHFQRLLDGLSGVGIASPYSLTDWHGIAAPLIDPTQSSQLLYIHVTRGCEGQRKHRFPVAATPTVLIFTIPFALEIDLNYLGCTAHTMDDLRWQRCNLKSSSLMGNVMAYRELYQRGVPQDEALLVRHGKVVEAPSSNLFCVLNGVIYTPPVENILPGVTRALVIELARAHGFELRETAPSLAQLLSADEVWVTNSMEELKPIVCIDGHTIGNAVPGPVWKALFSAFQGLKNQEEQL